ncbi:MAG: magnesium transporter [Defluviitaleaceae bacterium]|nr:magnesium transporter [Defluviitaleaceae bacterium]
MIDLIQQHIQNKDMGSIKSILSAAEEMEILFAFNDLTAEEQVIVFRLLTKNQALLIFEELDTDLQHNLLRSFTDERAIELVNELAPDDRVRLLDELPAGVAKKLIAALSPEERAMTNVLMGYKAETAGRIMTTEFISLTKNMTVTQASEKVRKQAEGKETIYTLFVTDTAKKLEGVLTLKELFLADPNATIEEVMTKHTIYVTTDTDQEEVAKTLQELDLLAIPVVDMEARLVGIVTIDDAIDILVEEATEDIYDQAGLADVTDNESGRSEVLIHGNLWKIWKVRLPYLLATLALGMLSGLVIDGFEETLEAVIGVAVFIPVIMGMGGNIGTQSSTVFTRGVVLGHIQLKNFFRHFLKEIGIGLSIGVLVGVLAGTVATVWLNMPMLGLAVGIAMVFTMTIAALLGFLVPYILIKLNADQAAGSAPIITTLKDLVALIIYFVCVSLLLGHML